LVVLGGTGDREKPLRDYSVTLGVDNYFYALIDQPTNADWFDDDPTTPLCGSTSLVCHNALTTVATGDAFDPDLALSRKGWKLPLRAGEQVVTGTIVVDNIANFSTHIPVVPESCDAEYGEATAYNINYANASGQTTQFLGGGLVPTPVAGKVLIDGVAVPFCIGCGSEGSAIGVGKVGGGITWTQPRSRIFWNIDQVED
jgi:type IV pilus assembly protein PilY1